MMISWVCWVGRIGWVGRIVAAALAVGMSASACAAPAGSHHEHSPSIVAADRQRLAFMRSDPVVAVAIHPWTSIGQPYYGGPNEWFRSWFRAALMAHDQISATAGAAAIANRLTASLATMRDEGWIDYYRSCETTAKVGEIKSWDANYQFYRVVGGVSYWANIVATLWYQKSSPRNVPYSADAEIDLIAPWSGENSDLFPDRPAALASSTGCRTPDLQHFGDHADGVRITVIPTAGMEKPHVAPTPGQTLR